MTGTMPHGEALAPEPSFTCRFVDPGHLKLGRGELFLSLVMILDGLPAEGYLQRMAAEPLAVGYRLLGRTSCSEPIFEHRAAIGGLLSHNEIEIHLWLPAAAFAAEPLRLIYINGVLEGHYWFHDHGHAGTLVPLYYRVAGVAEQ